MNAPADLILFNGRITTLDRQYPQAKAVAMRDGQFAAVGDEPEVMVFAGADTRRVDLEGRRVIRASPTTISISSAAASTTTWSCAGTAGDPLAMPCRCSRGRLQRRPRRNGCALSAASPSTSSRKASADAGGGQRDCARHAGFPSSPLRSRVAQCAALRACGYTRDTMDPPGRAIVRDGSGNPTGLLLAKLNAEHSGAMMPAPGTPLTARPNSPLQTAAAPARAISMDTPMPRLGRKRFRQMIFELFGVRSVAHAGRSDPGGAA
jgi:hypothetical protein